MEKETETLREAKKLCNLGYCITVNRPKSKIPLEKGWNTADFPTEEKLKTWFSNTENNLAVRTGETSKIILDGIGGYLHVLDAETDEAVDALLAELPGLDNGPRTFGSKGAGFHLLCTSHFSKIQLRDQNEVLQLEVLGDNCKATLPPSVHPDTKEPYEWVDGHHPTTHLPAIITGAELEKLLKDIAREKGWKLNGLRSTQSSLELISARELVEKKFGERKWIAKGIIPAVGVVFFAGKRGSNKTWCALVLAVNVARGTPFLEHFETMKADVLFLDSENGEFTMNERLKMLKEDVPDNIHFAFYPELKLDGSPCGALEEYLKQHPNCLIIIDSLRRVLSIDEDSAGEINEVFTPLKKLAEQYGVTFVVLHHLRKGIQGKITGDLADEMRGSSDMANIADSILIFEKPRNDPRALIMRHAKNRVGIELEPCRIEIQDNEGKFSLRYVGTWEELADQPERAGKAILKWAFENKIHEFKTADAVLALKPDGFNPKAISRGLKLLVDGAKLARPRKGFFSVHSGTLLGDGTTGQMGQQGLGGEENEG